MGIRLFSSSTYDVEDYSFKPVVAPNPDPANYRVLHKELIGKFLILHVQYPGCTNYEGTKILVYENVKWEQLQKQKSLDPHFSQSTLYHSPIARFVPTDKGWLYAKRMCEFLNENNRSLTSSTDECCGEAEQER